MITSWVSWRLLRYFNTFWHFILTYTSFLVNFFHLIYIKNPFMRSLKYWHKFFHRNFILSFKYIFDDEFLNHFFWEVQELLFCFLQIFLIPIWVVIVRFNTILLIHAFSIQIFFKSFCKILRVYFWEKEHLLEQIHQIVIFLFDQNLRVSRLQRFLICDHIIKSINFSPLFPFAN